MARARPQVDAEAYFVLRRGSNYTLSCMDLFLVVFASEPTARVMV